MIAGGKFTFSICFVLAITVDPRYKNSIGFQGCR